MSYKTTQTQDFNQIPIPVSEKFSYSTQNYGKNSKAVKKEESASEEEVKDNSVENSADGGDGPCKFYFNKRLRHCWTRLTVT